MTRYAMVADLNRCVGCQTCTAACKHANATAPGVQWRRVLDIEAGTFPDVRRAFVPVGCMHCEDPPCMHVCPSTATRQRDDGLVTIDYDLCIGCSYCVVACPYQARYKVEQPRYAYGERRMAHEVVREDPRRIGVAQKCTFCIDRIDAGRAAGLTPGVDQAATPVCVSSCIADALHFGDLDDADSNVSRLLDSHAHFVMHEELGTKPGFYYLWDRKERADANDAAGPEAVPAGAPDGVAPWAQQSWDWRAAANFMCGGAGTGLLAAGSASALAGAPIPGLPLLALALVGTGLLCVWHEIGRPWRFLNVLFHPQTSWMTREAMAALPLFALGLLAAIPGPQPRSTALLAASAFVGLAFLYCQGRILFAAKGIPAWREKAIVPLIFTTGLAEGAGIYLAIASVLGVGRGILGWAAAALMAVLALRLAAWKHYRGALRASGAPTRTLDELARLGSAFDVAAHLLPIGFLAAGLLAPATSMLAFPLAGIGALAGGWVLKHAIVTRAAFNQGFAVKHMPARGSGTGARGVKPGWAAPREGA